MASFIRKIEDFKCLHCGNEVKGDGYTNHCPKCLWSMHVDVNPGDREEGCKSLMEPISSDGKEIVHKCTKCGFVRKNKIDAGDNWDVVITISKNPFIC